MTRQQGFTLIEMAVVLTIIAFLISAAFMPLSAQRESNNIRQAREELKAIEEALYGFAIANGHLPCPTIPGNGGLADGGGAANCNRYHGFVPSTSLGIKGKVNCDGLLTDPWGNPYRYSITSVQSTNGLDDFAVAGDMRAETIAVLAPNLQVCRNPASACGSAPPADIMAGNAVVVVLSMGKHRTNLSALENENAGEGNIGGGCVPNYPIATDRFFYSTERIEIAGNEFDDILIWISPNILYNKMLAAGQLP